MIELIRGHVVSKTEQVSDVWQCLSDCVALHLLLLIAVAVAILGPAGATSTGVITCLLN